MGCLRINCYLLSFASLTRVFSPSATRPMRPGQAAWDPKTTKGISCRQTCRVNRRNLKRQPQISQTLCWYLCSALCRLRQSSLRVACRDASSVLRMQGHLVVGRGRSGAADGRRQVNRKEVRLGHEGRVYDSSKLSSNRGGDIFSCFCRIKVLLCKVIRYCTSFSLSLLSLSLSLPRTAS